jgi:hypothetical protein
MVSPLRHSISRYLLRRLPLVYIRGILRRPPHHATKTINQQPPRRLDNRQQYRSDHLQRRNLQHPIIFPSRTTGISNFIRIPIDRTINSGIGNRDRDRLPHNVVEALETSSDRWCHSAFDRNRGTFMHAKRYARMAISRLPRAAEHGNGFHVPSYFHERPRCFGPIRAGGGYQHSHSLEVDGNGAGRRDE